ncbi:DUF2155 domain-containing protein [Paroceanicella profunda]|uniref:DUF2155 domain-containing protein n=1 Tax=Paroceanicella profunda TaxID=2579971 RepID=A0A5B8FI72_9RHOB|nr:DUF2155 domain-containing protein [Paroceanicella profunda]QDL92778.1 DUF2155 domain-containing protein [Paroceanicella profunda]
MFHLPSRASGARLALIAALIAAPLAGVRAQTIQVTPLDDLPSESAQGAPAADGQQAAPDAVTEGRAKTRELTNEIPDVRPPVTSVPTDIAVLRGLDKMTGEISTFEMHVGEERAYKRLDLTLEACRRPAPGEKEDAYAWLQIRDKREEQPDFHGWMFASSPALSALDHPRYDVWVLSCKTEAEEASTGSSQN